MTLVIRANTGRVPVSTWLEGIVGALAMAGAAATFLFDPIVASTHGNVAEVATNLAYPTLDTVLLAFLAAGFVLQGLSAGRVWLLLALGVLISGAGDAVYLVQVAHGTYSQSGWVNATWPVSNVLIALAAWTPAATHKHEERSEPWRDLVLTTVFAGLIVAILAVEAFRRVPLVAHLLLTGAVIAMLLRLGLAVTERRRLVHTTIQARTDELTGLANRRSLYIAVDNALAAGGPVALILLDLNRFKELNDTLGHNVGDDALCQVALRLTEATPETGLVARLGGDEFVVLLGDAQDAGAVRSIARAVQESLEAPFTLDDFLVPLNASIGIAIAPEHARARAELLRCADVAMYRAKSQQTGVETYTQSGDHHSRDRLLRLSELRRAIESDELILHYQPKLALDSDAQAGVEALVRWRHPRLGLLPPAEFIPLAEREGLIRPLTLRVLDLALRQQRAWADGGDVLAVAVNLSPANLLDTRLPGDVASALERYGVDARLLELEITESTFMRDPERALDIIARLSELGVNFALDDFGTGYSSLAQLRHLPLKSLKIDRSFIANISDNAQDASIVRSTIEMARGLNLITVAEGVETAEHLQALGEYGCDAVQGFYVSHPVEPDEVVRWLRARPSRT